MNTLRSFFVAVGSIYIAASSGCSTSEPGTPTCINIPDGGCPIAYGSACQDPTCAAAYSCTSTGWVLDQTCPTPEAGPDVSPPPVDAGARDVDIDVPGSNGGPGCTSLIPPDCTLAAGASCPVGCCGCEDLYVCQNGGWNVW